MKKYLFIATALAALASCSDNEFLGDNSPNGTNNPNETKAIVFSSGTKAVTRAEFTGETAANMLNKNFVFAGTKQTGTNATPTTFVFDQYNANWVANTANTTESNTNDWEYVGYTPASTSTLPAGSTQTIKYWDYSATQYDFAAYSLGKAIDHDNDASTDEATATASAINVANKSYTLTGTAEQLKNCYISDLVTAYNYKESTTGDNPVTTTSDLDFGKVVQLKFRSVASKIRMALYESIPGYSVKEVEFYVADDAEETTHTESGTAVPNVPTLFTIGDNKLPSGSGTMTITFPTTGWDNSPKKGNDTDYNKAHITFAAKSATDLSTELPFEALANFAAAEKFEGALATGGWIGRASNAATYAGGLENGGGKYFTILPNETGANLKLRIKFKLVSTDGSGEVITVDKATAVIPAELAKWQPNYAYTYIFKISDMTNGQTGFKPDGTTPVYGLTPITLNAVVVDSEDGVQETITTVSAPSITTYMAGKVVTDNDEYIKDNTIYVVVNDGESNKTLTVGTDAKLYTVTNSSTIQTISEESVDNALRYGTIGEGTAKYTASIPAKDTDLASNGYYTESNGTYTAVTGTADGKTTYYQPVENETVKTYTVHDASGQDMVVTESNLLVASSKIESEDSPTGNEVVVSGARFKPTAAGTYVFQYKGNTAGHYGTYTPVAPATLATSGIDYYIYNENTSEYEKVTTVEEGTKVIATGTAYYTKGDPIYEPVTGALTSGSTYYYKDDQDAWIEYVAGHNDPNSKDNKYYTKNGDNYEEVTGTLTTGETYYYTNDSDEKVEFIAGANDPVPEGGYYTKNENNYIRVPYAKLTKDNTYYTTNRGAGKFTATGTEEVDAERKYFYVESGNQEVDGKYMYKVIKVVQ